MNSEKVKWALEQNRITEEMDVYGTTEYNILHIPRRARESFISIITPTHCSSSIEFWRNSWTMRDEHVKGLVGFERAQFLSECCYDETEVLFWENEWKHMDRKKLLLEISGKSR